MNVDVWMTESGIAEQGLELSMPHEMPWSCYRDEELAYGTYDACGFRL